MSGRYSRVDLFDIFVRAPANSTAAKVVGQPRERADKELSIEELKDLKILLQRKYDRLKKLLLIDTKAKKKNLKWKMNKNKKSMRAAQNPRAAEDLFRTGESIQNIQTEIHVRKESSA